MIVLFVIIVAFVGIVSAMQVLVLTSIATTSRAFDSYRQGASEMKRLERVVTEAILDQTQISAAPHAKSLSAAVTARLEQMAMGSTTISVLGVPASAPSIVSFPDPLSPPSELTDIPPELSRFLTPELLLLSGSKIAEAGEMTFEFSSRRTVAGLDHAYLTQVQARLFAVPLTRFPIAAYDLPNEIGIRGNAPCSGPTSVLPAGLAPSRDSAFVADLQAGPSTLPYYYRSRSLIAAAYQYVFSQNYLDRVTEYAGVTHFCDLDTLGPTAVLEGMTRSGEDASWDLANAGSGAYQTITLPRDAVVLFTDRAGHRIRLYESHDAHTAGPLLILLVGPTDARAGTLGIELESISRPVVLVGYNIHVSASSGVAVSGALFLDPNSSISPTGTIALGHFSYWAGSSAIPANAIASITLPPAAEILAPRVAYVATTATRL